MVRMIRDSFAAVADEGEKVTRFFFGMLFSIDPATRDLFPVNMETKQDRLMNAIVRIVQQYDRPDEITPYLRQLGREHRKFGVLTKHYESLGIALIAAIKQYAGAHWSEEIERAWAEAYTTIAQIMQEGAADDEGPAWWNAEVVSHRRINGDTAIVRVQTDYPVSYEPGQYMSVEVPQRPRLWRYLTPASAPAEDGTVEFHVRAVPEGWVSPSVVARSTPGDRWRLASPTGDLSVDREAGHDVLMVAGGTGIAPMRAILESLAEYGQNPNVHLFYGGRTVEDLYELDNLRKLAAACPWFEVTGVAESGTEGRPDLETGTLAEVVTGHGAWAEREVLLSGSPAMLRATVSQMLVAGTPLDRIRYDPLVAD